MPVALPVQMNASRAVVQASGASCLEMPTPRAGAAHVQFGAAEEVSPMSYSQDASPMAMSTAPASPWSPVTPAVASSPSSGPCFFPNQGGQARASFQGMGMMSPMSPAMSPTMSPGARIRRNAYRLGIPLDLKVDGILAPVPVAGGGLPGAGEVLAPSPHAASAPMLVEFPPEQAPQVAGKAPERIVNVPRPSASRFSGA